MFFVVHSGLILLLNFLKISEPDAGKSVTIYVENRFFSTLSFYLDSITDTEDMDVKAIFFNTSQSDCHRKVLFLITVASGVLQCMPQCGIWLRKSHLRKLQVAGWAKPSKSNNWMSVMNSLLKLV